jgi:hypothetical protein
MTFLQFLCTALLGPPAQMTSTDGESWWLCPLHNDHPPSFHTLPHRPDQRDYWKCFGCGRGGDDFQLLRDLRDIGRPDAQGGYKEHQALLERLRKEYARLGSCSSRGTEHPCSKREPPCSTPTRTKGDRTTGTTAAAGSALPSSLTLSQQLGEQSSAAAIADAYRRLDPDEAATLAKAVDIAKASKVDLEGLAYFAWHSEREFARLRKDTNDQHMTQCTESACDWYCCRLARGWTEEQIKKAIERDQRRRQLERKLEEREREETRKRVLATCFKDSKMPK